MKVIKTNKDKKIKWKYIIKNKLIIFTYYLKLFFYFKSYYQVILLNMLNLLNDLN